MTTKQLVLPGELVKKSNEFVRSRLKLDSVTAGKIFTSIIACIRSEDKDFKNYQISASALFQPEDKGGRSYSLIRKALKTITSYVVEMDLSEGLEPDYVMYPLFAKASYKNGIITAQIHPDLKPHFINLSKFTQYKLLDYLVLSSTYSQRLFEILNSYEKTCPEIKISLGKLHFMLNTPESLKQDFAQFRRRALEQAHKEITQKTHLEYEWAPIKQGRTVVSIHSIFSKKLLEERKKEDQQKWSQQQQRKYIKPALSCAKEMRKDFVEGKCPKEKKKTIKCRLCKQLDYFVH